MPRQNDARSDGRRPIGRLAGSSAIDQAPHAGSERKDRGGRPTRGRATASAPLTAGPPGADRPTGRVLGSGGPSALGPEASDGAEVAGSPTAPPSGSVAAQGAELATAPGGLLVARTYAPDPEQQVAALLVVLRARPPVPQREGS